MIVDSRVARIRSLATETKRLAAELRDELDPSSSEALEMTRIVTQQTSTISAVNCLGES